MVVNTLVPGLENNRNVIPFPRIPGHSLCWNDSKSWICGPGVPDYRYESVVPRSRSRYFYFNNHKAAAWFGN
jgi:hypothetical protein